MAAPARCAAERNRFTRPPRRSSAQSRRVFATEGARVAVLRVAVAAAPGAVRGLARAARDVELPRGDARQRPGRLRGDPTPHGAPPPTPHARPRTAGTTAAPHPGEAAACARAIASRSARSCETTTPTPRNRSQRGDEERARASASSVVRRLVEEEHVRLGRERGADLPALPLARRERRPARELVGGEGERRAQAARLAVVAPRERGDVGPAPVDLLRADGDRRPRRLEPHSAGVRSERARDEREERGLARAVLADERREAGGGGRGRLC